MAATQSKLGELHELLAEAFTSSIKLDMDEQLCNPALLSAAAKFLKDNEITADLKEADDLAELRDRLAAAARERRASGARILQAVENE